MSFAKFLRPPFFKEHHRMTTSGNLGDGSQNYHLFFTKYVDSEVINYVIYTEL